MSPSSTVLSLTSQSGSPVIATPVIASPVVATPGAVTPALESVATQGLWLTTIAAIVALFVADFVVTRKPHEVSMREALAWSAFYVAIPIGFGVWIWNQFGDERGLQFFSGYLVEKSLSVDNLFLFMILLGAFAVPKQLRQRVLLIGVAGALVLRGIFIAVGAQLIASFSWAFLLFGAVLIVTAVKVFRDARSPHETTVEVDSLRSVRLLRRLWPVTRDYHGARLTVRQGGRRALTPMALVLVAILATDIVFAIDSVPAVFGITEDPYLVFATNAFALLGLRALYFVVEGALGRLVHLGYGLAAILAFIGAKLVLHWAHGVWPWAPEIPTLLSLVVVIVILISVTVSSLVVTRAQRSVPPAGSAAGTETTEALVDHSASRSLDTAAATRRPETRAP